MARRPMMAANWKMNKTVREAQEYTAALLPRAADAEGVDVVVFAPFTSLPEVARMSQDSAVLAGGAHFFPQGLGGVTRGVFSPRLPLSGGPAGVVGESLQRGLFRGGRRRV